MSLHEREPKPRPLSFEEVVRAACEVTLRDGYHVPTFVVDSTDQVVFVQLESLAPTPEDRQRQMCLLGGDVAATSGAGSLRKVFFVAQSLIFRPENRDWPEGAPTQSPHHLEVLVVSGFDAAMQKTKTALFELLRDEGGSVHDLLDLGVGQDNADPADTPLLTAFVEGFSGK